MRFPPIQYLDTVAFAAVNICWVGFLVPFIFRKRPATGAREQRRDRMSLVGMLVQGLAFVVIWSNRRPEGSGFVPFGYWGRAAFDAVAVVAGCWAVWFVIAGVIVLGKQWSLTARVLEEHELATAGPYAIVRHPIYTAMVLMVIATGIVASDWRWTIAAVAVGVTGALMRIRIEERLLGEAFGDVYAQYARRVPALVPWLKFGG